MIKYYISNTLSHHGIVGQKWGIRKYQNEDGSLTAAGRERYGVSKRRERKANKIEAKINKKLAKSKAYDDKILRGREKTRAIKNERYDRKIDKIKSTTNDELAIKKLEYKKKTYNNDFDRTTKAIKKGQKAYNDTLKNYKDAKIDQLYNGKSEESKRAIKDYVKQRRSDRFNWGGAATTKLGYAAKAAYDDIGRK